MRSDDLLDMPVNDRHYDASGLECQVERCRWPVPEGTLRRLEREAQMTGRSVAALVRERIEGAPDLESVYAATADLAGCLAGRRRAATNARRRFRRA